MEVACDAAGTFTLPVPSTATELSVQAPCWLAPAAVPIPFATSEPAALADLVLPAIADLRIEFTVAASAANALQAAGYERVRCTAHDLTAGQSQLPRELAVAEMEVLAGSAQLGMRLAFATRFALSADVQPAADVRGAPPIRFVLAETSPLQRHQVARAAVVIDERHLIHGSVVGDGDLPLPRARVTLEQSTAAGTRLFHGTAGDTGAFVFVGPPGEAWLACATHLDASSAKVPAITGGDRLVLRCSTAATRTLRVRNGKQPLTHFAVGEASQLFGHARLPWLPHRPNGEALASCAAATLHLCWREGGDCYEVVVRLDAVQPRAVTEVDVATYLAGPLGALRVDFGRHAGILSLQCVRTDAGPPLLPLQLSLSATTPRHLLGIRAGTYRLQWRPSFLSPATHTVEVQLHGGHNALFVDDVLR
jgi:hypothetical protein